MVAGCSPCVLRRAPAKAVIIRSWHGPHSGELVVEMVGMASGTGEYRHAQSPNSSSAASPSRRQIEPASI